MLNQAYKINAIKIAKQLYYPVAVILRLEKAKTDNEIVRIMITARKEM